MRTKVRNLGLFLAGCVLGVGGVQAVRETDVPLTALQDMLGIQSKENGIAMLACTPQMQEDDIFFVTCGGIY